MKTSSFPKFAAVIAAMFLVAPIGVAAAADDATAQLEATLTKALPGIKIDAVEPTPIEGLYQVLSGGEVAYATADGQYMIQGTLYNVPNRRNLTEAVLSGVHAKTIQQIDPKALVVFPAEGEVKHVLTAFVDPTCPYCNAMFKKTADYNKLGITMQYAMYSRTGNNVNVQHQLEEILCAEDKQEKMAWYFAHYNERAAGASCALTDQLAVIDRVATDTGLQGTPHNVSGEGTVVIGYKEPGAMLKTLDDAAAAHM